MEDVAMSAASLLAVENVRHKVLARSVTSRRTCVCDECFICARERHAERELLRVAGAREAARDETLHKFHEASAKHLRRCPGNGGRHV